GFHDIARRRCTREPATHRTADERQPLDLFRFSRHIGNARCTAAAIAKKHKPFPAYRGNHSLQIFNMTLEGKIQVVAIGEAATAAIVPHQRMMTTQKVEPGTPNRAFRGEFEMMELVGRPP